MSGSQLTTRESEIASLLAIWRAAREQAPHLVLIEGEAGIGKSWLLQALRWRLGSAVVQVASTAFLPGLLRSGVELLASDRDPAFLAAARHLQPAGPWMSRLIEPGQPTSKEELNLAIAHAVCRAAWQRGGACLLLEDLHDWSRDDLDSLRLLLLRAAAARAPLLVVASSRPTLDREWWLDTEAALSGEGGVKVERRLLAALGPEEVAALAAQILRTERLPVSLAPWLYERATGQPLHTVELLRFLVEGEALENLGPAWQFRPPRDSVLPQGLEAVLDLRLEQARSDPELWEALAALAVLERPSQLHEWSAVSATPVEQLEELGGEAARLALVRLELEGGRERYALAHPLYPSRLRAKLDRRARRELHRRAAEALVDSGERARQARLGAHPRAEEWSWEALAEAKKRFAYDEVRSHAEALMPRARERQGELHFLLGEALFYQGEFARAEQALAQSDASAAPWLRALALRRLGRLGEALELVARRVQETEGQQDERLAALEVSLLLQLGREQQGRSLLAVRLETATPGSYARAVLLLEYGRDMHRIARYQQALAATEEAAAVFRRIGDSFELFRALNNIGIYASQLGLWERSETALSEAIALAEARGNRVYASSRHLNLGSLWLRRGLYQKAEDAYLTALRLGESSDDREVISSAVTSLAEVRFLRGDLPSALELHRRGLAEFETQGMERLTDLYRLVLGQVELHCGVAGAAAKALLAAENLDNHPQLRLMKADALLLSGRAQEAADLLDEGEPQPIRATVRAEYAIARSLVQIVLGREESARSQLEAALELLEGSGHAPLLGLASFQLAVLERLAGREEEARRLAPPALGQLESESAWGHLLTLERLVPEARRLREEAASAVEGRASYTPAQAEPADSRSLPFLRTLGAFEIEQAGETLAWRARKPRELLALLLVASLREGGPWVGRERIIADLWPESESGKAEASFRTTVKRLREAVRDAARVERNQQGEYRLELLRADVTRFLRFLESGDAESAVVWYGGEFLPGIDVAGVEIVRERLRANFRSVVRRLAGDKPNARSVELHQRLLEEDPYDLEALQALTDNLMLLGEEGRARRTLESAAKRFNEELGAVPEELSAKLALWNTKAVSR